MAKAPMLSSAARYKLERATLRRGFRVCRAVTRHQSVPWELGPLELQMDAAWKMAGMQSKRSFAPFSLPSTASTAVARFASRTRPRKSVCQNPAGALSRLQLATGARPARILEASQGLERLRQARSGRRALGGDAMCRFRRKESLMAERIFREVVGLGEIP